MNYILLENMEDDGKLSEYILNNYKNIKLNITNGKIELIEKTNIKKITPIIYEIKLLRKKYIILYFKCNEIESHYKSMINSNNKVLTTNELIKTFEELGLSKSKYNKLRDNYYKQKRISNYLMECAIKYVKYEEERLDKENEKEYDKEMY